jgi:hypothetical protein
LLRLPKGALLHAIYPGVIAAGVVGIAATFLSQHYNAPVMLFALLLGMAFRFLHEEGRCVRGIEFSAAGRVAGSWYVRGGVAFMQAKVNFDERRELVKVVSNAIGRRQDQLILDALTASSATSVSNDIGGSDTNMNVAKLRSAAQTLNANNVPMDGRHIIIHASSLASLLSETAVTSSDFNSVKALVQGEINTFLGFTFHTVGDRSEGGLIKDGSNDRTCFAFHGDAVGLAEGIAPKTEINYVPEKTSFLIASMFSAGAVAIDDEGIVKIICRES